MGWLYWCNKPDYERKDKKEYLFHLRYKFQEYDEFSLEDIADWYLKVVKKTADYNYKILIDVTSETESNGSCDGGTEYIVFTPFYIRKETNTEYNIRIKKEEDEYNEKQRIMKLEKEQNEEYLKDRAEYERIKNKYHF